MKLFSIYICIALALTACYKEVVNVEPDADTFSLRITGETQQFIYDSRDTSYTVDDPELQLLLNDQTLDLKEIRIRGKSALRYQRKSYAVFLHEPIVVTNRNGNSVQSLSRFKLLALAMDYTYIENRLAFGILEEAGVMPLFYKFVEFRINEETQGVYLLVEDPEQFYKENGSEFILRRGYNHHIEDSDYEPSVDFKTPEAYETRYKEIYGSLTQYQGKDLYTELVNRMDLMSYYKKLGIDYLLQNGDYTDELFLYAMVNRDTIRFHPIPWDYDDLFADKPHEIGRSWGMGTLFGTRYYETMNDFYDEVGQSLIFSIEDDLDYIIAKDPYLYQQYLDVLSVLFDKITPAVIETIFTETRHELSTFYNSISVIEQSIFDEKMTNKDLWMDNMREKQALIEERFIQIQTYLEESR